MIKCYHIICPKRFSFLECQGNYMLNTMLISPGNAGFNYRNRKHELLASHGLPLAPRNLQVTPESFITWLHTSEQYDILLGSDIG